MSNNSDERTGSASGSSAATGSSNRQLIGFCHECNQQGEIDNVSFTCKRCNGGFIELFELDDSEENNSQHSNRSSSSNPPNQRVRIDAIRVNNETLPNILPMLIPQLFGSNLNIINSRQNASNAPPIIPTQFPLFQTTATHSNNNSQANTTSNTPNTSSTDPNQANSNRPQGAQGPTRLQFIVPGEQVDLYGIINSVLSDILDPRRQAPGGPFGGLGGINFQTGSQPIRMFQLHGDLRDYAWGATGLDTIITQLLNQLENTGPPPASDDQIDKLPHITITQVEVDKNLQCAICMEDFNLEDTAIKLPCKHHFHKPCITEWLRLHGTCPVCRKNLNGEDTSQREYISRPAGAGAQSGEPSTSSTSTETNPNEASSNTSSTSQATTTTQQQASPQQQNNQRSNNNNNNLYNDMDFD